MVVVFGKKKYWKQQDGYFAVGFVWFYADGCNQHLDIVKYLCSLVCVFLSGFGESICCEKTCSNMWIDLMCLKCPGEIFQSWTYIFHLTLLFFFSSLPRSQSAWQVKGDNWSEKIRMRLFRSCFIPIMFIWKKISW